MSHPNELHPTHAAIIKPLPETLGPAPTDEAATCRAKTEVSQTPRDSDAPQLCPRCAAEINTHRTFETAKNAGLAAIKSAGKVVSAAGKGIAAVKTAASVARLAYQSAAAGISHGAATYRLNRDLNEHNQAEVANRKE